MKPWIWISWISRSYCIWLAILALYQFSIHLAVQHHTVICIPFLRSHTPSLHHPLKYGPQSYWCSCKDGRSLQFIDKGARHCHRVAEWANNMGNGLGSEHPIRMVFHWLHNMQVNMEQPRFSSNKSKVFPLSFWGFYFSFFGERVCITLELTVRMHTAWSFYGGRIYPRNYY